MSDEDSYYQSHHRSRSRERRRHYPKRRSHHHHHYENGRPIEIRVGSRRSPDYYVEMRATGPRDVPRFEALIDQTRRLNPNDPILL